MLEQAAAPAEPAGQAEPAAQEAQAEPAWYVERPGDDAPDYSGRHRDLSLAAVGRRIKRSAVVMLGSRRLWGSSVVAVLVLIIAMVVVTQGQPGRGGEPVAGPGLPDPPAPAISDASPDAAPSVDPTPSAPVGSTRPSTGATRPPGAAPSSAAARTSTPPASPTGRQSPVSREAESARLGQGMQIVNLAGASGGKVVRFPSRGGGLSLGGFTMTNGGRYQVRLYYTCTGSTTAYIRVAGGPLDGHAASCGGSSTIRTTDFSANFNGGANTVEVGFASDSAQLDRIVVS